MGTQKVQDLVGQIVRAMVDQPEEVRIGAQEKPSCTVIQIYVADDDVRKVVGRKGKNLQAIRQIVQATTVRPNRMEKRFTVDFDDPRMRQASGM